MAKQVKFALGKATGHQPLAMVNELTTGNIRRDCTTRPTLELACLAEAGRHFTQANTTPCFQMPIWEIFGALGVWCRAFDQVLEGTFTPPSECDPFTKKVLEHLKRPLIIHPIPQPSLSEYIYGWQRSHEETSSSYSSIHFGHYIAGTYDQQITQFNASMAAIPALTSYSPSRWRHGLNVMLEKIPGNFEVERLCIILLFEADCNQNNKWLGHAFMKEAECCGLLTDEQYGSHQNKDAITQCLNKQLWYDYIRCTCQPAALCSNDAKSCYD